MSTIGDDSNNGVVERTFACKFCPKGGMLRGSIREMKKLQK
jgi:hypothetical protein